jgi:hypothetical protein
MRFNTCLSKNAIGLSSESCNVKVRKRGIVLKKRESIGIRRVKRLVPKLEGLESRGEHQKRILEGSGTLLVLPTNHLTRRIETVFVESHDSEGRGVDDRGGQLVPLGLEEP